MMLHWSRIFFLLSFSFFFQWVFAVDVGAKDELTLLYDKSWTTPSSIHEHVPILRQLAKECNSVIEIGSQSTYSTWGLLMGLSESSFDKKTFLEIELVDPPFEHMLLKKHLARANEIDYRYIAANDLNLKLNERADLLFIDSLHTYAHLTYELETFSPLINKYIVMHDTSPPWGYADDSLYKGDYSEYPASIDRKKRGLSAAVNDFLAKNPGWELIERRCNCHGLITLRRVEKPLMKEDPSIHVYIHACTISSWRDVLNRQLSRIRASGLYDACDSISIGVLGKENLDSFLTEYPKIKILFQLPDVSLYERPTLLALHDDCLKCPQNTIVLYLHTKGVTRKSPNVTDWTKMMEYFLIDQWRNCVAALKDHDICGVNWQLGPKPHFSGNFWWATGAYISTLPHYIKESYLDPEMWLAQNRPEFKCFHKSNVDHYHEPYPESKYIVD